MKQAAIAALALSTWIISLPQNSGHPSAGVSKEKSGADAQLAKNAREKQRAAETTALNSILATIAKSEQERSAERQQEAAAQSDNVRFQRWMIGLGIAQTLALIGTLIAVWYQAKQTRIAAEASRDATGATQASTEVIRQQVGIMERQTKAGEDAAIAAQKGVAIIISKERARVSVDVGNFSIGHPNDPPNVSGVAYTVQCDGATRADILSAWVGVDLHEVNTPASRLSYAQVSFPAVLRPNDKGAMGTVVLAGVAGTNAQPRFIRGELYAHFYGDITYKDLFGGTWIYEFSYLRTHDSSWIGSGKGRVYEDEEDDDNQPQD